MTDLQAEKAYWDHAAADPDVATKYIADVDTGRCLDVIQPQLKHGSILEIGCGIGRLTEPLANKLPDSQIHGIDISPAMIELCPDSTVKYMSNDGRTIPYSDESFDSIYSMLVFQHIPDLAKIGYIHEAYRTLKSGGVFVVQYVEGQHHGDIDHNTTAGAMVNRLQGAGFEIGAREKGLIHQQWNWIKAVKS